MKTVFWVECICGRIILKNYKCINAHLKTNIHKKYLQKKINYSIYRKQEKSFNGPFFLKRKTISSSLNS